MDDFSVTAHADIAGLSPLLAGDEETETHLNLAPHRDDRIASYLLRMIAIDILLMDSMLLIAHQDFNPSIEDVVRASEARAELGLKRAAHTYIL